VKRTTNRDSRIRVAVGLESQIVVIRVLLTYFGFGDRIRVLPNTILILIIMSTARDPPPASTQETGLQKAKTNLTYLALGSGAAVAPSSLATRSFLTTTRYVTLSSLISTSVFISFRSGMGTGQKTRV
jgi:hypothetical protein